MSKKKKTAKKSWQTWRWILCILFGLSALSCLAGIKEDLFVGIVMFVCCGAIAFFLCPKAPIYKKKTKIEKTTATNPITPDYDFIQTPFSKTYLGDILPKLKNNVPMAYSYLIAYTFKRADLLLTSHAPDWKLTANIVNGELHLFSSGTDLGEFCHKRAEMLNDWIRRDEPYEIIVRSQKSETEFDLLLGFYRDKKQYYQHREQELVKLVSYKSSSKQGALSCASAGEEVKIEEDFDGGIYVFCNGEAIGKLPAKVQRRFEDEGIACVYLEKIEEEETDDFITVCVPTVRIYW